MNSGADHRLRFLCGMPRSGTTVLANLLGQNPEVRVTPTSGLIHLWLAVIERWPQVAEFQSQGLQAVKSQVESAARGLLLGYYEEAIASGRIVIDKSRGWLDYLEPLEGVLRGPVRCVAMIRDVRGVVGSFEKLYRRRGIEWKYPHGEKYALSQSVEQRSRRLLDQDQVVGRSIVRFRDALARCPDKLLIVPYRQFTIKPLETAQAIGAFLNLPDHTYDPNHIEQITHEDDNFVGMDLHRIRSQVEPQTKEPWRAYLPDALAEELAETYADINQLASGDVRRGDEA